MQPEVRTVPVEYTICGHSLRHKPAKRYAQEVLALLDRVWRVIKANAIPNDGINRVVQEGEEGEGYTVVAGMVLGLTQRPPGLAWVGTPSASVATPYHFLPATGAAMTKAFEVRGLRTA